jgi:hypothetical protein
VKLEVTLQQLSGEYLQLQRKAEEVIIYCKE